MFGRIGRGLYHGAIGLGLLAVSTMFLDRGGVLNLDDLLQVGRHAQQARASQGSCVMPTTGTVSGLTLVVGINSCFAAILTSNSGTTAPANGTGAVALTGQVWLDTSGTLPAVKYYDGTSWVTLGTVDNGNHVWVPVVGGSSDTVASATTTDLWSVKPASVSVSGTATITALASASAVAGTVKVVRFTGAATLTHNATSLILPGGANITTASGDSAIVLALTSTNVAVVSYSRATGQAVVNPAVPVGTLLSTGAFQVPDANYLMSYGQAVSRATYPALTTALTITQTGTRTNGSGVVTGLSDTTQLRAGMFIEATGFIAGTVVASVDSSTQVTLGNNASSSGSASLSFFPYGNGNGSTTIQLPDCRGSVLAGPDNLGGTPASRLTTTYFGAVARPGAVGNSSESFTMLLANLAAHTHTSPAVTDPGHTHPLTSPVTFAGAGTSGASPNNIVQAGAATTQSATTGITLAATTGSTGSATPMRTVQPTLVANCMIRVL